MNDKNLRERREKNKYKQIHKLKWISLLGVSFKICACDVTLRRNDYWMDTPLMLKESNVFISLAYSYWCLFPAHWPHCLEPGISMEKNYAQDLCSCLSVDSVSGVRCVAFFSHLHSCVSVSVNLVCDFLSTHHFGSYDIACMCPFRNWYKFTCALNIQSVQL